MQGVRNVLANEGLFLPSVDTTIDLLRIVHGRIMALNNELHYPIFHSTTLPTQNPSERLGKSSVYAFERGHRSKPIHLC
jgi:hypothetical protein